uniref:Uncharacterized protein n=1 Tax=Arundo donax TaxID=35708 RepID=A0A0A9VNY9_ARUDO
MTSLKDEIGSLDLSSMIFLNCADPFILEASISTFFAISSLRIASLEKALSGFHLMFAALSLEFLTASPFKSASSGG